jgi:hypothetical protein
LIYSGVPAGQFGLKQVIEVGPDERQDQTLFFGWKLAELSLRDRVNRIYERAKQATAVLTEEECRRWV